MLLAGLLLGFLLPGYAAARKLCPQARFSTAFLLSCLILFFTFVTLNALSIPLRFATLAPALAIVTLAIHLALRRLPTPPSSFIVPPSSFRSPLLLPLAAVLALLIFRTILAPLRGPDTPFRWDYLATAITAAGHFHFYPPRTPDDFRHYFYPDGFPPLVSCAYAWLYLSAGVHAPRLTTILIAATFAATLAFTARAAAALLPGAPRAAPVAAALCAGCPMLFHWTAVGQETGLLCLSVAATLYFLAEARKTNDEVRTMNDEQDRAFAKSSSSFILHPSSFPLFLASAATALAANLREYGPAFILFAAVTAAFLRLPPRRIAFFVIAAIALSAPWYVRNLYLTGNPVYSNRLFDLPVNESHAAIMDAFAARYSPRRWTAAEWRAVLLALVIGAPLVLPLALIAPFTRRARRHTHLLLFAAGTFALFLWSAPYTSGGPLYAVRVATPALIPLAILATAAMRNDEVRTMNEEQDRTSVKSSSSFIVLTSSFLPLLSILYTLLYSWPFPYTPADVRPAPGHTYPAAYLAAGLRTVDRPVNARTAALLRDRLPPGSVLLTDNAYLPPLLRPAGIPVVPVWSPDLLFLLDPTLSPADALTRLRHHGITHILYNPPFAQSQFLARLPAFTPDPTRTTQLDSQTILITVPAAPAPPTSVPSTREAPPRDNIPSPGTPGEGRVRANAGVEQPPLPQRTRPE